jgi:hypothetical protein
MTSSIFKEPRSPAAINCPRLFAVNRLNPTEEIRKEIMQGGGPDEPSDEQLLKTFRSHLGFENTDPGIYISGALDRPRQTVGELLANEKKAFITTQRALWRQQRAEAARLEAQARTKAEILERARAGEGRRALKAAADGVRTWQERLTEFDRELGAQRRREKDLLDDAASSATDLADAHNLVGALTAKRTAFAATRAT